MIKKTYNRLNPEPQNDSPKVKEETKIYYSKFENFLTFIFSFFFFLVAIFSIFQEIVFFLIIILIVSSVFIWKSTKKIISWTPIITLNKNGIKINNLRFYPWELVHSIEIEKETGYRHINYTMRVYYGHKLNPSKIQGSDRVNLKGLSLKPSKIEYLIDIYKLRHKKENLSQYN